MNREQKSIAFLTLKNNLAMCFRYKKTEISMFNKKKIKIKIYKYKYLLKECLRQRQRIKIADHKSHVFHCNYLLFFSIIYIISF